MAKDQNAESYLKRPSIDLAAKKTSIDLGKSPKGLYLTTNNNYFSSNKLEIP